MSTDTLTLEFLSTAAGTDDEFYACVPYRCRILAAYFAPATAASANGTNYATLTLTANDGAGGAYAAVATAMTTASVAMAVDTSRAFTITAGSDFVVKGGMLKAAKTEDGTGALLHGSVVFEVEKLSE